MNQGCCSYWMPLCARTGDVGQLSAIRCLMFDAQTLSIAQVKSAIEGIRTRASRATAKNPGPEGSSRRFRPCWPAGMLLPALRVRRQNDSNRRANLFGTPTIYYQSFRSCPGETIQNPGL